MVVLLALLISGVLFATLIQGNSLTVRQNAGCSFHLSTGGAVSYPVGQLDSGQARAASGMSPSVFTWFGDAFVDQQGRGCWWTPPSMVLQCDPNQEPDHDFDIDCHGVVSYKGQSTFYECGTGDGDQVNIYLQPPDDQCQQITMMADGCTSACSSSPSPGGGNPQSATTPAGSPSSVGNQSSSRGFPTVTPFLTTPASMPPSPTASPTLSVPITPGSGRGAAMPRPAADCPADLSGPFEYPHLLVQVDHTHPEMAYGSSQFGQVSPNASSVFNFDIPPGDAGKSCKVFFAFPEQSQLHTSMFYFSGDGSINFARLGGPAGLATSYSNTPPVERDLGNIQLVPGNTYVIEQFDCPAGTTISYMMDEPPTKDTCLIYFQDYNPSPIGLFISKC